MLDAMSVGHIVANAGHTIVIRGDEPLSTAAQRMRENSVGSLIVVDEAGRATGILTERDIVCRGVADGPEALAAAVRDAMTPTVLSCTMDTPIDDAEKLMTANGIRHLPVIQAGRPVAMLSARDVVSHQIAATHAMQAAAGDVAALSRAFRDLDYEAVLDLVTQRLPVMFGARWGVLCVGEPSGQSRRIRVASRRACPCPQAALEEDLDLAGQEPVGLYDLPPRCKALGAGSPRTLFRLPIYDLGEDGAPCRCDACLCMCRFEGDAANTKALLGYRAALLQEILSVNLLNAKLHERTRRDSQVDPLTGAKTRRVFEARLGQEYERAVRYRHPFCVAILDLDHFKGINDGYGHLAGDHVLRELAERIRQHTRGSDLFARYGGDEFVVLLPETEREQARTVLERIRQAVGEVVAPDGTHLSVSCGIAAWSLDDATDAPSGVLRRADEALYEAKRLGRNRVEAAA